MNILYWWFQFHSQITFFFHLSIISRVLTKKKAWKEKWERNQQYEIFNYRIFLHKKIFGKYCHLHNQQKKFEKIFTKYTYIQKMTNLQETRVLSRDWDKWEKEQFRVITKVRQITEIIQLSWAQYPARYLNGSADRWYISKSTAQHKTAFKWVQILLTVELSLKMGRLDGS